MSKQDIVEGLQCVLCGWFDENAKEPRKQCPECGCGSFRRVDSTAPRDWPSPEAIAHLKKKVENCWNYQQNAGGGKIYHHLKLVDKVDKSKALPTIPADKAFVTIRNVCETCGELYHVEIIPVTRAEVLREHGLENLARVA